MCVRLVLLARCTALNVFAHEVCESQPPKLRGDELASLEITWVASSLMVMAMGEDRMVE